MTGEAEDVWGSLPVKVMSSRQAGMGVTGQRVGCC